MPTTDTLEQLPNDSNGSVSNIFCVNSLKRKKIKGDKLGNKSGHSVGLVVQIVARFSVVKRNLISISNSSWFSSIALVKSSSIANFNLSRYNSLLKFCAINIDAMIWFYNIYGCSIINLVWIGTTPVVTILSIFITVYYNLL